MALTIAIEGYGEVTNAESTTGWGVTGSGGIAPVQETDIVLQGSFSVSCKVSGSKNAWLHYNIGTALDFTTTYAGQCVFIWFNITTIGALNTRANEGVAVAIGSSTGNYRKWVIGGSDEFANNYSGGWQCAVIDPNSPGT